jgi:hypothetical protein
MTEDSERIQILRMVEARQITVEEGARLLAALERSADKAKADPAAPSAARWFRVRVTDLGSGKERVNVNIPVGLVSVGMRLGARFAPGLGGAEAERIVEAIKSGTQGKIMDMEDARSGERVEIYVE